MSEKVTKPRKPKVDATAVKTPGEWMLATKNVQQARFINGRRRVLPNAEHAAADALHGWSLHDYHDAKNPLQLALDDYEKAIEAAKRPPKGKRSYEPHEAALSPHRPQKAQE